MAEKRWITIPNRVYRFSKPDDENFETIDLTATRSLGSGVSGQVWEVEYGDAKRGALKVYNTILSENERISKQFDTETSVIIKDSRFVSPITFGEFTVEDKRHAVLFPFIEGQTLLDFIKQNPNLPLRERYKIVREIAAAMNQLHSKGWLHNDIKPENIMINLEYSDTNCPSCESLIDSSKNSSNCLEEGCDENLRYKLSIFVIDFQLSCKKHLVEDTFGNVESEIGTRGYIAPEVLFSGASGVSIASDVWAIGATAFFVLTGIEMYDHLSINFDQDEEFLQKMSSDAHTPVISTSTIQNMGIDLAPAQVISNCLIPITNSRKENLKLPTVLRLSLHAPNSHFLVRTNGGLKQAKTVLSSFLNENNISVDLSELTIEYNQGGSNRFSSYMFKIPDRLIDFDLHRVPFFNTFQDDHIIFNFCNSTNLHSRAKVQEQLQEQIDMLDIPEEELVEITVDDLDLIINNENKEDEVIEHLDNPPKISAERVRINIHPSGMIPQVIMASTVSSSHLSSSHFSQKSFPNRKLVNFVWDGEKLVGTGQEYVTFENELLKNTEIPNGGVILVDGIQTRISYTPM